MARRYDADLMSRHDVVIIGGGLAGMMTARLLARDGVDCLVVEARPRVGGRLLSRSIGDARFDLGGQWLARYHHRALALVKELDIETFETVSRGDKLLELGGTVHRYRGAVPWLGLRTLGGTAVAAAMLELGRRTIDLQSIPSSRLARARDEATLADWLRRRVRPERSRTLVGLVAKAVVGCEPSEITLLQFLFYLHSHGGLLRLISAEGGAQELRIAGGAQRVVERIADALPVPVVLGQPVRSVASHGSSVTVTTATATFEASRVVVAVPPVVSDRIAFTPERSPTEQSLDTQASMSGSLKFIATYERPFWRDRGLSAEVLSDGLVTLCFDNTDAITGRAALVGFIRGAPAHRAGDADVRERVLGELVRWFGEPAGAPTDYAQFNWCGAEHSEGCHALFAPGVLSTHGAVELPPRDGIHWAGAERSAAHHGYMEGALASAERVAREITATRPVAPARASPR